MKKRNKHFHHELETRLLDETSPFAIREAFNHLRTNLLYTINNEKGGPIFAVTSAGEASGKSTLMANIAISYATASKKILLIDADMRAPMQCNIFHEDKSTYGLSELLSGIEKDDRNVIRKSETEGLSILFAGQTPPNPSELIMSSAFEYYLKKWRLEYDAIFIDFPPVGIVTDTLAVHKLVTGYIFVVRSERSEKRSVAASLDTMKKLDAKILGIVLNDVDSKILGYGGRYVGGKRYSRYSRYSRYDNSNKYEASYANAYEHAYAKKQKEEKHDA